MIELETKYQINGIDEKKLFKNAEAAKKRMSGIDGTGFWSILI